jgi:hypothetical protein
MAAHEKQMNAGGVSEALGFLLIFTMVIVGIGLVTLYGYPVLLAQQNNADETIMQKNMIVLQNDVKSLAYKTVPYKETSLKIGGGGLTVYNATYMPASSTIRITDSLTNVYEPAFHSGDLRYESLGAQSYISLQNGAVVRKSTLDSTVNAGSAMLAQPRWFYDGTTNTMVVNLISINSSETMSRAGIGTVQMQMGETSYTPITIPAGNQFFLEYTPDTGGQDYGVAWDNYFTQSGNMAYVSTTGSTKKYAFKTDPGSPPTLIIKKYDVWIKSL